MILVAALDLCDVSTRIGGAVLNRLVVIF